jgi:pimeloyl-ACP methyl ester carboxylesterase
MTESAALMAAPWRYVRIDGASHWMMLDQPQRVNELMLDWLQQD